MSKFNHDLPKHAADKVQRALDDVLQLTADPGEKLRIYLLASGICIGGAGGILAAQLDHSGDEVAERAVKLEILDLLRRTVSDGAEAAWNSLSETATAEPDMETVREIVRRYHAALDNREHGGTAAHTAVDALMDLLDMPWPQKTSGQ